jgi:hypothetical protein
MSRSNLNKVLRKGRPPSANIVLALKLRFVIISDSCRPFATEVHPSLANMRENGVLGRWPGLKSTVVGFG